MRPVRSSDTWASPRPYSPAVVVGADVHVSGHVPVDRAGRTSGVTAREQTTAVLGNIALTLSAAGATLDDVVSTSVYLTDIADIDAVDEIYREVFTAGSYPARTTVEIAALGRAEFLVEISAVARLLRPPGEVEV